MKKVTIDAYTIDELNERPLTFAFHWLDKYPLEYEMEDGATTYSYCSDIWESDKEYVIEHCEINDYLFDKEGNAIHHLIKK